MESSLLVQMIERMSIMATLAFVLSQTSMFRQIIYRQVEVRERVLLILIFGCIGILGTYAGIPINDALANSRVIGVMAAGLVGGPVMGVATGLIAGGHRYFQGGFTAFSCGLANVCEGLLAGLVHRWYPVRPIPWWVALAAGMVGEIMQMGIILLTARPYAMAHSLVEQIAMPMITANSLGLAVFLLIVKTAMASQEMEGAKQSRKALDIATQTLPYLRQGLDERSAQATAKIIYNSGGYDAVSVTDNEHVLAFVGAEAEHHAHKIGLTRSTRQVLASGEMYIAQHQSEIGCDYSGCKLASAAVVPLKRSGATIGALKLYYVRDGAIGFADRMFASGLAHLFSTQLELTEIDRQSKLAAKAKMKALYAQINPHFLFNTLNTITSLIRTKPDQARELLLKLSAIFRYTLHKTGRNITLAEEMAQVRAYLTIEKARHGDKLTIEEKIAPETERCLIPSLIIQPLVENAINHGLQPKAEGGHIVIQASIDAGMIIISVADNGVGMDLTKYHPLTAPSDTSIGLSNVHERIRGQYGVEFGVSLCSILGSGTTVTMRLPIWKNEEGENCDQNFDCR
ncbi:MAG: sensor histidine kinase [Veillonellales bacterium]